MSTRAQSEIEDGSNSRKWAHESVATAATSQVALPAPDNNPDIDQSRGHKHLPASKRTTPDTPARTSTALDYDPSVTSSNRSPSRPLAPPVIVVTLADGPTSPAIVLTSLDGSTSQLLDSQRVPVSQNPGAKHEDSQTQLKMSETSKYQNIDSHERSLDLTVEDYETSDEDSGTEASNRPAFRIPANVAAKRSNSSETIAEKAPDSGKEGRLPHKVQHTQIRSKKNSQIGMSPSEASGKQGSDRATHELQRDHVQESSQRLRIVYAKARAQQTENSKAEVNMFAGDSDFQASVANPISDSQLIAKSKDPAFNTTADRIRIGRIPTLRPTPNYLHDLLWDELQLGYLYSEWLPTNLFDQKWFQMRLLLLIKRFGWAVAQEDVIADDKSIGNSIFVIASEIQLSLCARGRSLHTVLTGERSRSEYSPEPSSQMFLRQPMDLGSASETIRNTSAMAKLKSDLAKECRPSFHQSLSLLALRCYRQMTSSEISRWRPQIRMLERDLSHVPKTAIQVMNSDQVKPDWLNKIKIKIESWTGESWDWSPLVSPEQPLASGLRRVVWKCKHCGEKQWVDVPTVFGDGLSTLTQGASDVSSDVDQRTSQMQSSQRLPNQLQHAPGPDPFAHFIAGASAGTPSMQISVQITGRVLVVVESGESLKLTQIPVNGKRTIDFFRTLRSEYFRLRGILHTHLSVWRFSHCDFYRFIKWDSFSYAPHKKNEYPEPHNKDYLYDPCPPDLIPPVSEHEFRCRFRSCTDAKPSFLQRISNRLYRRKPSIPHSDELLKYIPKKVSQLDESNEARETFWTLYARQRVSLIGVVVYIIFCLFMPAFWFFFMWIFGWNHREDLQGASVPLSLTLGALSIFMSVLLSSMRFGRDE